MSEGTAGVVPLTPEYLEADRIKRTPTLTIMVGIPRSGKTSVVNNQLTTANVQLVCRDDIRRAMGYRYNQHFEREVSQTANLMIEALLLRGLDVLVDECNVTKKRRTVLINIAKKCKAHWTFIIIPVPTDEELKNRCLKTNFDPAIITKFKSFYEPVTADEYEIPVVST